MKSVWDQIREDLKRDSRRFLRFWGIGALVIIGCFLVYWMWNGPPTSIGGAGKAIAELLVLAVLVPPIVWLLKAVMF